MKKLALLFAVLTMSTAVHRSAYASEVPKNGEKSETERKVEEEQQQYEDAVKSHAIIAGMSWWQAYRSWGNPCVTAETTDVTGNIVETWTYCDGGCPNKPESPTNPNPPASCRSSKTVVLVNKRVKSVTSVSY